VLEECFEVEETSFSGVLSAARAGGSDEWLRKIHKRVGVMRHGPDTRAVIYGRVINRLISLHCRDVRDWLCITLRIAGSSLG